MAVGISTRAAVRCDKHGQLYTALPPFKVVFVSMPKTKNQRKFGGCPFCKREQALT
jgi:hypothetical protein